MPTLLRTLAGVLFTIPLFTAPRAVQAADGLVVFAAASLKESLDAAVATYAAPDRPKIVVSYASSGALARQIENGAPADLFISADQAWMDYLGERKLIDQATRRTLLTNRLVLVAPADRPLSLRIAPGFALAQALGDGRLAIGDPATVPAGRYAQAALESLGVWSQVASRTAPAESVRAALALVVRGEVPLGIVYRTDAISEPKVRVVGEFAADSHPPIVYPAAVVAGARPAAGALLDYLASPAARAVFARFGF